MRIRHCRRARANADVDGDGDLETVPLFDDSLQEFFWQYDNQGLRLAQLRFYDVPSDTN